MLFSNPLPSSLAAECTKCSRILQSFIEPGEAFGPDKIIPPDILENAKGLAILSVIKAGFVGSARFGSGLVVARRGDGSWSAPSAIATTGLGVGGQIGLELTEFVFVLNDMDAVMTFAQSGSVTLGGNVSLAAGPVGRNAEAAGAASLKSVAAIFSYSKTKGLFAGISLEGSAIVERRDANEKLYGHRYRAVDLLLGSVQPPAAAGELLSVLNSRMFSGSRGGPSDRDGQNEEGVYDSDHGHDVREDGRYGGSPRSPRADSKTGSAFSSAGGQQQRRQPPPIPRNPKPKTIAIAIFTFQAVEPGDLGFQKGDVIEVLKKTDSDNDWWTGRIGERQGIFPSNYVKVKE